MHSDHKDVLDKYLDIIDRQKKITETLRARAQDLGEKVDRLIAVNETLAGGIKRLIGKDKKDKDPK